LSVFVAGIVTGVKTDKRKVVWMLEARGERSLKVGDKVKVYPNTKNGKFSIVNAETGLVVAYADRLTLKDVKFVVGAGGQEKERETGKRNIHAVVVGTYMGDYYTPKGTTEVYYNAMETDTFQLKRTGKPIHEASFAWFNEGKVFI
jgi:UDP-N-acetylmuramyl tripeptide synthase